MSHYLGGLNHLADQVPTWAGFVYLAVVLDVYSRKVVGWAFGQQQTAVLVIAALNMALITRKPQAVITIPTEAVRPESTGRRNTALLGRA